MAEDGGGGDAVGTSGWRDWRKVRSSASASSSRVGAGWVTDVSKGAGEGVASASWEAFAPDGGSGGDFDSHPMASVKTTPDAEQ